MYTIYILLAIYIYLFIFYYIPHGPHLIPSPQRIPFVFRSCILMKKEKKEREKEDEVEKTDIQKLRTLTFN